MLYSLLYPLHETFSMFNVFRYITFRTALATLTALLISLALGPRLIQRLRHFQIGQQIRPEGPLSHQSKKGTPTMGGLLILIAVILPTLLWADPANPYVWIALISTLLYGVIGFADDYLKLTRKRSLGLTARQKFAAQMVVALGIGLVLLWMTKQGFYSTHLSLPFFKRFDPDLGWVFVLWTMLVVVGAANAVNLTDGLDGLAIGSSLIASGTYAILAYVAGHAKVSAYLDVPNVRGAGELAVICGALVGASLGFLWFNCNPAQVFMGDVGSMAIGGGLGTIAILIKQEVLLIFVGGLFVIEALSVIAQVGSFKLRGKRVLRMAPIHHHFELAGWPEQKVVIRFWIVALIFALLGLSTLKLR
ncbi:MAG TPA: phospho-N-acetylmuramoyl-pentapeptide-transferase [Candidatus Polarisedimenticolia bacterium]|nr:phospho-N-acetylmuramoyl-pentapeptide-transferase [Candidatus Polarisedimenticolia bacterium]